MSKSPFFQFYPSDWLAGTRGLTAAETGVYITLIAMMYEAEGPIPYDATRLARLCGSTPAAFRKAVDGLVDTGKLSVSEDGIFNRRVQIEIEKRSEKRLAASQSAKTRWGKAQQNQTPADANASNSQCERNANQKPETRKRKEEPNGSSKNRGSRLPDDWVPDREFAEREGLAAHQIDREADKFRDYWRSQPGQKGVKRDWAATWKNWVRNTVDRMNPPKPAADDDWRSSPTWAGVDI